MRLHSTITFLFAASLLCSSYTRAEHAPSNHALICDSLIASGNPEYPPFLWREKGSANLLVGANRIIMDELGRRIGIPITLKYVGPWSQAQLDAKNGAVDILAGAFYTNSRASYMDFFSPVMLHTTSVVWLRKNHFVFHSKDDLMGKWGVTVMNNSFGQDFDSFSQQHLNVLSVSSLESAFRMLVANRVDYVLYEKNPGMAYASMLGIENKIVSVQPSISSEGLYLTLSKKSPCNTPELKQKIAVALSAIHQEGFAEKALLKGIQEWRSSHITTLAALKK